MKTWQENDVIDPKNDVTDLKNNVTDRTSTFYTKIENELSWLIE